MRRLFNQILLAMVSLLISGSLSFAEVRTNPTESATCVPNNLSKQAPPIKTESTVNQAGANQNHPAAPQAAVNPATGELIKWRVVSGGGQRKSSAHYVLNGTLGQIAAGEATTTNYKVNQGFWQAFVPAACCLGTTGNTDGDPVDIVDISDVFAIVGYLVSSIPMSTCFAENEVTRDGTIDISDLQALVDFLVISLPLPACP